MSTTIQSKTTQHLSDMAGAQKHILEAISSQLETSAVKESPEASAILSETKLLLRKHVRELEALSDRYDAETKAGIKKLFTNVLGNLAGAYNHMRGEGATRAVRDTYTALNLLSASLLALKTYGLMVSQPDISKAAYDQLTEICPLVVKFNQTLPFVVARETAKDLGLPYAPGLAEKVKESTQKLWN